MKNTFSIKSCRCKDLNLTSFQTLDDWDRDCRLYLLTDNISGISTFAALKVGKRGYAYRVYGSLGKKQTFKPPR